MRNLALVAATAVALAAGAASVANAAPAGSALPNGVNTQSSAEQVGYGGRHCFWYRGHWHCDRGQHRGWYRPYRDRHWRW
jgi:hypothetical protein